jgi:hypothetical protein
MRGPGAAPLRMENEDQRKFGYGGDGGAPSQTGLFILLGAGAWALWEYKRPGGALNPQARFYAGPHTTASAW